MTSTADRVYEALVCDDAFTTDLGGHGAWADILADEVPLATAFSAAAAQVGAAPNLVEALVCPDETAARLAGLVPPAALMPVLDVLVPAMLEVDGQIDALVAVERHIGRLQARSPELLAALDAADASAGVDARPHGDRPGPDQTVTAHARVAANRADQSAPRMRPGRRCRLRRVHKSRHRSELNGSSPAISDHR